jgi:hypothetical protein
MSRSVTVYSEETQEKTCPSTLFFNLQNQLGSIQISIPARTQTVILRRPVIARLFQRCLPQNMDGGFQHPSHECMMLKALIEAKPPVTASKARRGSLQPPRTIQLPIQTKRASVFATPYVKLSLIRPMLFNPPPRDAKSDRRLEEGRADSRPLPCSGRMCGVRGKLMSEAAEWMGWMS